MGYSVMCKEHLLFENTKSELLSLQKTLSYFRLVTENCSMRTADVFPIKI